MRRINNQVMRLFNVMQIIRTVQRCAPISRTALTEKMGLTAASVTNLTNGLLEAGILRQVGVESNGNLGRKAMVLDVLPDAFYTLGMEMNNTRIVVGLADFHGDIIASETTPFDERWEVDTALDQVVSLTNSLLDRSGVPREKLLGMGLSLPGPLDSKAGILRSPPNLVKWRNVPICDILSRRLGIPVCCDRETNAAALAESICGASVGYETSFMLSLFPLGIGGGFLFNGQIVRGFWDGAGEIGHTTVQTGGAACVCGGYGCLETVVSAKAIVGRVRQLWKLRSQGERLRESLTLEQVFRLCDCGDPVCRQVVEEAASYIGIALRNVINTISPQIIVLAGPMVSMSSTLVQEIQGYIRKTPYPHHAGEITVCPTALGDMAFVKGGVMLAMDVFLEGAISRHINCLPAEHAPLVI